MSHRAGVVPERVRALIGLGAVAAHVGQTALATQALGVGRTHPAAGGEAARLAAWSARTCGIGSADGAAPASDTPEVADLGGMLARLRHALTQPGLQAPERRIPG